VQRVTSRHPHDAVRHGNLGNVGQLLDNGESHDDRDR